MNCLLQTYIKIWDKISSAIKNEFDSKPVYIEKYLKTKIKSYEEKMSTKFYDDRIPIEGCHCKKLHKNYYPQVFLQCKYIGEEKKIIRYITDNLEISSEDSDKDNSDEED